MAAVRRPATRRSTLRLIDANANRALEGLRVCEEIVRFHLEVAPLFLRLRRLRHAIAAAIRGLPIAREDLLRARESRFDVGRQVRASRVASLEQTLVINLQRTKEALRVLEECARVTAPRHTSQLQRLRFTTYEIERDLLLRVATLRHS